MTTSKVQDNHKETGKAANAKQIKETNRTTL